MFFRKNSNTWDHSLRDVKYVAPMEEMEPIDYYTDEQLIADAGGTLVWDIECYTNYFQVAFKNIKNGKVVSIEKFEGEVAWSNFSVNKLFWILQCFTVIGFNTNHYDDLMLFLSCKEGITLAQLKACSNDIIADKEMSNRDVIEKWGIEIKDSNRIDVKEVAPGKDISLKKYAARLNAKKLQDLPYDESRILTADEAKNVHWYCINDLNNTQFLFESLNEEMQLRDEMSSKYGMDLRSKSDAQIAEAVITSEVKKLTGKYPRKYVTSPGESFGYVAPSWMKFRTEYMQKFLRLVQSFSYELDGAGRPIIPAAIGVRGQIKIGNSSYTVGNGGLHSTESAQTVYSDEDYLIVDRDVTSYYPFIILNNKLAPPNMGDNFLKVFEGIVFTRIAAKKNGNKKVANSLKIVINGSFGKLGSRFSRLFAPSLMIQTTVTGQLALLLLIESLELEGFSVVSANTDGVVIKCLRSRYDEMNAIIARWEAQTKFNTEETRYKSVHSHSCNNYIAVLEKPEKDGTLYKGKGYFGKPDLTKDPRIAICVEAAVNQIIHKKRVEDTVKECQDIKKFCSIQQVRGGAEKDGVYLGKMIRWYYRKNEYGAITRVMSGDRVAKSTGAWPLMTLPTELPGDVDRQWYIAESYEMLKDIGYTSTFKETGLAI